LPSTEPASISPTATITASGKPQAGSSPAWPATDEPAIPERRRFGHCGRLDTPWGVAVDSAGGVHIADTQNHVVRKVTSDGSSAPSLEAVLRR
jgi:hypothetical protein